MNNFQKVIILIIVFLFVNNCYALELEYPVIFDHSPGESITTFAIYVYIFLMAIGSVLVLLMLIMAGIEFITSEGELSKISKAKERIRNSIIGLVLLFGSWMILYTINEDFINPKIEQLMCEYGITVEIEKDGKKFDKCIIQSESSIDGNITTTKSVKIPNGQVKEIWAFSQVDFKGVATLLFQDLSSATDKPIGIISIPGNTKSIKIIPKKLGYYLYDKTGFGINSVPPFFLSGNVNDLANVGFDNLTESINIIMPKAEDPKNPDIYYGAVLFPDPGYRGKCTVVEGSTFPDLGPSPIGSRTLSSIITYELNVKKENIGSVVFYNTLNCGESSSEEVDECEIQIFPGASTEKLIAISCPDFEGDIVSFRINGPLGVVLRENTKSLCQYWDLGSINFSGNCISDIRGSDVYSPALGGKRPYSFMAFQIK
jgi:hypothetical protein